MSGPCTCCCIKSTVKKNQMNKQINMHIYKCRYTHQRNWEPSWGVPLVLQTCLTLPVFPSADVETLGEGHWGLQPLPWFPCHRKTLRTSSYLGHRRAVWTPLLLHRGLQNDWCWTCTLAGYQFCHWVHSIFDYGDLFFWLPKSKNDRSISNCAKTMCILMQIRLVHTQHCTRKCHCKSISF